MLRIHFTAADLARTRIAAAPDPLWETALSMHLLRNRRADPVLAQWKQQMLGLLDSDAGHRAALALPLATNPAYGYFPDFLTPFEAGAGLDAGLDAVLRTPKARLDAETRTLRAARPRPESSVDDLARGDVAALRDLESGLRYYHRLAVLPLWERIRAAFDADRASRSRLLMDHGVAALLGSLHPLTRYHDGVLEIANYIVTRDLHLDGRGLLLLPSYFKWHDKPMMLADPLLPPVLVYPMHQAARLAPPAAGQPLGALVGHTRAAILDVAADIGTTTEVANRVGITVPSASRHLSVLRKAGLVVSVRDGNTVLHTLTPLGRAMLDDC